MKQMIPRSLFVIILALPIGCLHDHSPREIPYRLSHFPPRDVDVMEALLANAQVELTDSSCRGAGTELSDKTVGEYISGFLIGLNDAEAKNYFVFDKSISGRDLWKVQVMMQHAKDEDVWAWGIEFKIHQSDGRVNTRSFRCRGGG
jgi:hypothetical protein